MKTSKTRTPFLLQGITTHHQPGNKVGLRMSLMNLTETGFRRWVITNFSELKEHVLSQCKETKNLEKRFEEIITRMDNLERNKSDLKELKNTIREFCKACTSFKSRIDQAEERISEVEDQLNEIKQEGKI